MKSYCSGKLQLLVALGVIFLFEPLFAKDVFELIESTKIRHYSDITFYARLPKIADSDGNQENVRDGNSHAVRGVLALCTQRTEPNDVKVNVTDDGRFKSFVKFADKHNLVLVTWTNFKGYRTDVSGDEMYEGRYKQYDKDFDDRAREWRTGFRRLCRKYDLPEKNVLMYGISGGAQMAHRLALRMPEYFFGVHVQFNRYKLYWDGPDERRQFFVLDRSGEGRRGEQVFIERGKDWKATVDRRGEILIEALDSSGWAFRYDEGRLQEFKLGDSADTCRITWSGRDLPLYITNQSTNRRILEIEYRGSTDPERILIGETRIEVEMGDGELTAPDGETNYRNYRVSFLCSLQLDAESVETFEYSKAEPRQRKIPVLDRAKKKVSKAVDLKVNRMQIAEGATDGATDNWVEWEAKSGFITADSGSNYTVKNDSWDPNIQDGSLLDVTPSAVEMKRLPEGGTEQRWSYVWNSGVKVYTDLATGEIIRRTMIMSEGPANGKLRKREILKDGSWTLDRQNSYDPKGRPVRAVHGDDMRIWKWEDVRDGSEATEYLNGSIVRRTVYDRGGDFVEREIFKADGDVDRYVYGETGDGRSIVHYLNGEAVSYKELDGQDRLSYMKWADGREQFWDRSKDEELFLTLFPDGREHLVERKANGAGYTQIEAAELVSDAVRNLTQTRN